MLLFLQSLIIKEKEVTMNRIIIPILVVMVNAIALAQTSFRVDVATFYDDNLYRTPEAESDFLSQIGLRVSYSPEKTNFSYFISLNYITFAANNTRNFLLSTIGANYDRSFGNENQHEFFFGVDWMLRMDKKEYDYYDYNQFYMFTGLKLNLNYFYLKAGYNFRYRNYSNLPELTNSRHYGFVQFNKSFATRTSLILEGDLGYKSFAGQVLAYNGSDYMWGRGRRGGVRAVYSESNIPSMSHAILLVRVAQSLHSRVGVYVQYRKQISLTNETSYQNVESYFQDEELFDDPFSYSSETVSSQLTWILPWQMKLQAGGGVLGKEYVSEQAFVSADDSLGSGGIRKDNRAFFYANLSKSFFIGKTWLKLIKLTFEYSFIDNQSNSYWYNYRNSLSGINLQWKF